MNSSRNICLCGFMAAGKSRIGAKLAALMQRNFLDLDSEIEHRMEMKIPEIFKNRGEAFFRTQERVTLLNLLEEKENSVIALGGGALQNQEHTAKVLSESILVYLRAPEDVIVARLSKDKSRPKLRKEDGSMRTESELKKLVQDMLSEREPLYLKSNIIFDISGNDTVDTNAENLYRLLHNYEG